MSADPDQAAPVCAAASCTRPAAAGMLCAADERRLGDWLAQIGSEYELLSAAPSMQGREVGTIGGTSLTSQRSPGNTHVMAMRDPRRGTGYIGDGDPWGIDNTPSVFATLASYADRVREGRDLSLPVRHVDACRMPCMHRACMIGIGHVVTVPLTVATERRLLAAHLDWILGQDFAGEFFDEIRGLFAALRRANGHASTRPGYTAHCDCGGRIRWANGAATCQACGTSMATADGIRRHSEKMSA